MTIKEFRAEAIGGNKHYPGPHQWLGVSVSDVSGANPTTNFYISDSCQERNFLYRHKIFYSLELK